MVVESGHAKMYLFGHKMVVFPFQNNPKNLDPSYKMDLDFWDSFRKENPIFQLNCTTGPGCSKLTTSLVNETSKFQTLISQICQYFFC